MITVQRRGIVDEYKDYSFARPSTAYDSKGRLYLPHNARFVAGAFEGSQALYVEERTENLVSNGSFETDSNSDGVADDWTAALYGVTPSLVDDAFVGIKSQQLTSAEGGTPSRLQQSIAIEGGKSYTLSGKLKTDGIVPGRLYFITNGTEVSGNSGDLTPTSWTDLSISFTAPVDATSVTVRCYNYATDVPGWVRWDAVQLEAKPYATSFTDSTRSPEVVTIPTAGVVSPSEGTIEARITPALPTSGHTHRQVIFEAQSCTPPGTFWLERNFGGELQFIVGGTDGLNHIITSDTLQPNTEYYVGARWNENGTALFLNDVLTDIPIVFTPLFEARASAGVGCGGFGAGYEFDGSIDDLRISDIARSDAEILAAYQSNQPLPVDEHTTLKLNFDGPDSQRSAKCLVM